MSPDPHSDAFKFLHEATFPGEREIEQMSPKQINEALEEMGYDIAKLDEKISAKQSKWAGRFALIAARQKRLAEKQQPGHTIEVPPTKEAILLHFQNYFGDQMPVAAQRCRGMDYDELAQLYRDLISEKRSER